MTDHYRIKELEWKRAHPKYHDWESLYMYGRGLDWAQITDTINGYELSIDREYYDTLDQAKAAANEHHRREVEKMLEPSPDRRLTTKEALANVDMEKVGLEASIEQLLVILEAKDMLLAEAANGLRDALGAFENNNAIDWDELEQTLSAIKHEIKNLEGSQELGEKNGD